MIKTKQQALEVQQRRYASEKTGIAKAVRNFMKRELVTEGEHRQYLKAKITYKENCIKIQKEADEKMKRLRKRRKVLVFRDFTFHFQSKEYVEFAKLLKNQTLRK